VAYVEFELMLAVVLVVLVIYCFLGSLPRHLHSQPVGCPLSIVGTFAAMYLLGYSLNNLSLMALTISTGFVVDDAIVDDREHLPLYREGRDALTTPP